MVIKLNKGIKKDLAIVIGNQFSSVKEVKVNALKHEIKVILEPLKTLNKRSAKSLQKLVPKEFGARVEDAVDSFKVVQAQKPKRPLSQYMCFSANKSKESDFVSMSFNDRGKAIAQIWNGLKDSEKQKFNLSAADNKKYTTTMSQYQDALRALKTEKR